MNVTPSSIFGISPMVPILLLVGACLLVFAFSNQRLASKAGDRAGYGATPLRVQPRPLMTGLERDVLYNLELLFPQLRVHAQVSMGALIEPARDVRGPERKWMHRRYNQKVVDFVLQDRDSGKILCLLEVDDHTHNAAKDLERDKITYAAGYRTIRLPASFRATRATIGTVNGPLFGLTQWKDIEVLIEKASAA